MGSVRGFFTIKASSSGWTDGRASHAQMLAHLTSKRYEHEATRKARRGNANTVRISRADEVSEEIRSFYSLVMQTMHVRLLISSCHAAEQMGFSCLHRCETFARATGMPRATLCCACFAIAPCGSSPCSHEATCVSTAWECEYRLVTRSCEAAERPAELIQYGNAWDPSDPGTARATSPERGAW